MAVPIGQGGFCVRSRPTHYMSTLNPILVSSVLSSTMVLSDWREKATPSMEDWGNRNGARSPLGLRLSLGLDKPDSRFEKCLRV